MLSEQVAYALDRFGAWLASRSAQVGYVYLPGGAGGAKQGADDFLAAGRTLDDLIKYACSAPLPPPSDSRVNPEAKSASGLTARLAEQYQDQRVYTLEHKCWMQYGVRMPGIWSEIDDEEMYDALRQDLEALLPTGFSWSLLQGVERMLRGALAQHLVALSHDLLPFQNGVLEIATGTLQPHHPLRFCTWYLPYDYHPSASCEPVQTWFKEAMQGDTGMVEVLRAYLRAVVTGRVDLQRFLECLGPGGTGKGTFQRLAMALVGYDNVFVTELKYLETNRFEAAHIVGKRLVLITDSERYGGPVSVLKALTGQDAIRWEQKYHKHQRSFTAEAMVIVAANEPIQSSDYTSGLERRRLTVPFRHRPNASKRLLEFARGDPEGLFAPYLAGVMNWVLAMPEAEMTRLLVRTREMVLSMQQSWAQTLLDTNPLAEWANTWLIHEPKAHTNVGVVKKSDFSHGYEHEDVWLYPNYYAYTEATGHKPVSLRRFSGLLEDLCQYQLRLEGVARGKNVQGAHFTGLRLRQNYEIAALLITEASAPPLTESGSDDGSDGSLTAKTDATDGSDGSDGCFESSQDKATHAVGADEKRQQAPAEHKETIEHPSDPSDPSSARLLAVSDASASRHQPETEPLFDTPTNLRRCPHCGGGRLQVRVASGLCEACGHKITS